MAAVRPVINGQMDHHSIREPVAATSAGAYYIIPGDGVLILRKVQQRALIITRNCCALPICSDQFGAKCRVNLIRSHSNTTSKSIIN